MGFNVGVGCTTDVCGVPGVSGVGLRNRCLLRAWDGPVGGLRNRRALWPWGGGLRNRCVLRAWGGKHPTRVYSVYSCLKI